MIDQSTAYHIELGPSVLAKTDAKQAVSAHPLEWSFEPWSPEERKAWVQARYEREVAEAKRTGKEPPPQPEDPVVTEEQAAAEAEYAEKVKEAKMIVAKDDEEKRKRAEYEGVVAAARSFLTQPPPMQFEPERVAQPEVARRNAAAAAAATGADDADLGDTTLDPDMPIPDDWRDKRNSQRKGLALRLGADKHIRQEDVNAFIEAEIDRRKAAGKPAS